MLCYGLVAGLQVILAGHAGWRSFQQRFWFGIAASVLLAGSAAGGLLVVTSSSFWLVPGLALLAAIPATIRAFRHADADAERPEGAAYALLAAVLLQLATLVVVGFGHVLLARTSF